MLSLSGVAANIVWQVGQEEGMIFLGGQGGGVVFLHPVSTADLGLHMNCPIQAAPPGGGRDSGSISSDKV